MEEQSTETEPEQSEEVAEEPAPESEESPSGAPEQEAPEPAPPDTPKRKEKEPEEPKPPEVAELLAAAGQLADVAKACEKALDQTASLSDQKATQKRLAQYSHDLAALPKALQMLNDYRRHIAGLAKRAETVRSTLVKVRKDPDAITSEEARVIVAVATAKDTVLASIVSLESILHIVRQGTLPLLALIGYDRPGFTQFAEEALGDVRVDMVSETAHTERARVEQLARDVASLIELEEHAKGLGNA